MGWSERGATVTPHCHRHTSDIAEATCRACKLGYCEGCLVYTDRSQEPLCVPCALSIAGVRTSRQRRLSRKQRRALVRDARTTTSEPEPGVDASCEEQARIWAQSSAHLDLGTT